MGDEFHGFKDVRHRGGVCGGGFGGLGQIVVRDDVSTSVGPRDVVSGVAVSTLGCLSATTTTS